MKSSRVFGLAGILLATFARAAPAAAAPAVANAPDPQQIPLPPLLGVSSALPAVSALPVQTELPPALRTSDGRTVSGAEWPRRRTEMAAILEHYFTGQAPPAPGNVTGSVLETRELDAGRVRYRRVQLNFGPGAKLRLNVGIFTPRGPGPFPALIDPAGSPPGAKVSPRLPLGPGQGEGVDALLRIGPDSPPKLPTKPAPLDAESIAREHPALRRGYAYVVFDHNDCGEDTTLRSADGSWAFRSTRFFPAYPRHDWGLLRAWAWGVSRIVDYLTTDAAIDASALIVTGFSRTGKAALIAGAFDERIALTAPVATGGGGVGSFRHSGAGRGGKEGLDLMLKKYPNWFAPTLHSFWGHTDQLPFDQHWLLALIAPRAFIALEGEADPVSLASAVRKSWSGAAPVFALLGATDKLAVNYAARAHAVTPEDYAALFDFSDSAFGRGASARRFDRFPPAAFEATTESAIAAGRVTLWNGRDLEGWSLYLKDAQIDPQNAVRVKDGILRFEPPANGYLKTERAYSDFHLHVEWRWPKDAAVNANSGVMLHLHGPDTIWPLSFECQLKNGNAGQVVGLGLDIPAAPLLNNRKRAPRLAPVSERPLGEWNTYEIYARADRIEAFVNGVRQNDVAELPVRAGQIALQLEGFPIEFREVWLEPLASTSLGSAAPPAAKGAARAGAPAKIR